MADTGFGAAGTSTMHKRSRAPSVSALNALDAAAALSANLDPASVVQSLLRTALSWSGAVRGALLRRDVGCWRIDTENGIGDEEGGKYRQGAALAPGHPMALLADDVLRTFEVAQHRNGSDWIGLPLCIDAARGWALCLEAGTSRAFSHKTLSLLKTLARVGAAALSNAHRFEIVESRLARLGPLFDANIVGVFFWDLDGRILEANDAFLEMVGYSREDLAQGLVDWKRMTPSEFAQQDEQAKSELAQGTHAHPYEKEYVRKDGSRIPLMLGVSRFDETLRQGVCVAIDISELKAAEGQLEACVNALQESRDRLGTALQAGRMGIWRHRLSDDTLESSCELNLLLGYPPYHQLTIEDFWRGLLIDPAELRTAMDRAVAAGEPVFELEFAYRRQDTNERRWLLVRNEIIRDAADNAQELVGIFIDITERKEQEERQQLLLNELNHRVKNTLAIVMGIVDQTLRRTHSPDAIAAALQNRLHALSKSHNLLTEAVWQGAGVRDLVMSEFATCLPRSSKQVVLDGENLMIGPKGVVTLGLAIHELVTNAVRYGALSVAKGQVCLCWRRDDDNLHLVWQERGGPPVSPPARTGFGMTLLQRGLAREFVGGVVTDFAPEGFRCEMRLSMARMAQT